MPKLNFNASSPDSNPARHDSDVVFRKKVAIQQFMNAYGPLFRAFAVAGKSVNDVIEGEILKDHAEMANRLARLIAARVHKKDPTAVSAAELRPFRTEAAEYVANRWIAGRNVDVEAAASEIAAAVDLVDGSWDHDMFRDDKITDDVSLMMSVVAIAGNLSRAVAIYDFRLGKTEAVLRLLTAVVEASVKTAEDMLKDMSATQGDRRNLTQTLARNFTSLMEVCYERKVREVTGYLKKKPLSEKKAFYAVRTPLDEVITEFREWSMCISGWAVMASRDVAAPRSQPDADMRRQPEAARG